MDDAAVQNLRDRLDVIETCTRMAWFADRRDWTALSELFDDEVDLDYASLTGGPVMRLDRDTLVDSWAGGLAGLKATQHLVSNHLVTVEGDTARCTAAFQATHVLPNNSGGPLWTLGGYYEYGLRRTPGGWLLTSVAMVVDWASGNQHISTLAMGH